MTRYVDVRFDLLRSGAKYTELHPVTAPVLTASADAAIKSSIYGEFYADSSADYLTDELRPVLVIDGQEHPLGVFSVASYTQSTNDTRSTVSLSGYDRCWTVQSTRTENVLHLSQGSSYIEVIRQLLLYCGISLVVATANPSVLSTDREDWDLGTDYLTIINSLLSEINYNDLWFDTAGYARIEPKAAIVSNNIRHTFDEKNVKNMILPRKTVTSDIFSAPNVFICICDNPDYSKPLVAVATNDNPASALSVPRRRRRISEVVKVNNIASLSELEAYAQLLVRDSMMSVDTVEIQTALLPGYGVNEVAAINYGSTQGLCLETGYTMELTTGGTMQHTLRMVSYNIG